MARKPTSKKTTKTTAKTPPAMRYLQTRLSDPSWRALKMLSLEAGEPLQSLVVTALNDLLVKHGKKPVIVGPPAED